VIYTEEAGAGFILAGLTMNGAGKIFGVSALTAFELSPHGKGGWKSSVIHTFAGYPKDGSYAYGTPVRDKKGNIYGTTQEGGKSDYGTVYKLTRLKKRWQYQILYEFTGGPKDGYYPFAGVTLDKAGNIYGTTALQNQSGFGTVFELEAPVGEGKYTESLIFTFNNTDGSQPLGGLLFGSGNQLYGTTYSGGSSGNGIVFAIAP